MSSGFKVEFQDAAIFPDALPILILASECGGNGFERHFWLSLRMAFLPIGLRGKHDFNISDERGGKAGNGFAIAADGWPLKRAAAPLLMLGHEATALHAQSPRQGGRGREFSP